MPNHLDTAVLAEIISLEAPEQESPRCHGRSCKSSTYTTLYRCDDCQGAGLLCDDCTIRTHRVHPFHRLRRWNMEVQAPYFERVTMADLDYEFCLGHNGYQCPSSDHSERESTVTFVDVNGVFKLPVRYCVCSPNCLPADETPGVTPMYYQQLLRNQLYPASKKIPKTAYSFRLLKHFHRSNLSSKTAAYDYCEALKRLTNSVRPQDVSVCYILSNCTIYFMNEYTLCR